MSVRVYLVPGFFGFAAIGEMKYFTHVKDALRMGFGALGVQATLIDVPTLPTSALQRRAGRLADIIAKTSEAGDELHIIGHSTGGLDARMMLSPGIVLPTNAPVEELASRVRSVVSVGTPHAGAPIADFFTRGQGERLLRLLSIGTLHLMRLGTMPQLPMRAMVGAAVGARTAVGSEASLLDDVWKGILRDFPRDRQDEISAFFREVWADRSLLPQLRPEGIAALEASLRERPGVRYGSVVLESRPPAPGGFTAALDSQLYRVLYRMSGWQGRPPALSPQAAAGLREGLGATPGAGSNDAIVPTLSQVHGQVIDACWADHLDILGFFRGPDHRPPHVDWLRSGSQFGRLRFERAWREVAEVIAATSTPPSLG